MHSHFVLNLLSNRDIFILLDVQTETTKLSDFLKVIQIGGSMFGLKLQVSDLLFFTHHYTSYMGKSLEQVKSQNYETTKKQQREEMSQDHSACYTKVLTVS